ncbi:hypothetical protein [Tenacibaculum agarivorans]|uniref:hypothetical protein n=1 Tax=Tenacibaculum agarivorans TaxID=1908389 RepID=UPI000A594B9F|nr:hypothetical protein [Tenacibaculum agarivorans]
MKTVLTPPYNLKEGRYFIHSGTVYKFHSLLEHKDHYSITCSNHDLVDIITIPKKSTIDMVCYFELKNYLS